MRILHTSDWHLGRLFYGLHLTDDQAFVLDQLVKLITDARVDLVIVAGDVYDRAVPPPEAVALLDETLSRIQLDTGVPVILISGNHDSPERLNFASRLLSRQFVHVYTKPSSIFTPLQARDQHGTVQLFALPYSEPVLMRETLDDDAVVDHKTGIQALLERALAESDSRARQILITHAFVLGGEESESERPLSVGGSGAVPSSLFEQFHYVALGHLHRPQTAGQSHISYSGSLLKYSFSEVDHKKSVSIVEIDGNGKATVEKVALTPRRDVRKIEGKFSELMKGAKAGTSKDDYIMAVLTDEGALLDPMARLRDIYPNLLHIERPFILAGANEQLVRKDHRKASDLDLFRSFYQYVTSTELTSDQELEFANAVNDLRKQNREVSA